MYWLSKRVLPTPALECADPALTLSYRLWTDLRIEGILPARCQLDSPQFRLMIPDVQWLDMDAFRAEDVQPRFPNADAVAAQIGSRRRSAFLVDAIADDVRLTAFTGCPLFQIIDLSQDQQPSTLQLLLIPFADDGAAVGEVLIVARVAEFSLVFDQLVDLSATN